MSKNKQIISLSGEGPEGSPSRAWLLQHKETARLIQMVVDEANLGSVNAEACFFSFLVYTAVTLSKDTDGVEVRWSAYEQISQIYKEQWKELGMLHSLDIRSLYEIAVFIRQKYLGDSPATAAELADANRGTKDAIFIPPPEITDKEERRE